MYTISCLSFNLSLEILIVMCLGYWKEAVLEVCWVSVLFDRWCSQDIDQGVGMSDPSFNLSESLFSGFQKLSVILTVANVYFQR